jgi:hypothetical protein
MTQAQKAAPSLNVGQDLLDPERERLQDVVGELDGGELVVLLWLGGTCQRLDDRHVDLDPVAGQWLLVALPSAIVPLVALGGGQPDGWATTNLVAGLRGRATPTAPAALPAAGRVWLPHFRCGGTVDGSLTTPYLSRMCRYIASVVAHPTRVRA